MIASWPTIEISIFGWIGHDNEIQYLLHTGTKDKMMTKMIDSDQWVSVTLQIFQLQFFPQFSSHVYRRDSFRFNRKHLKPVNF